MIKGPEYDAEGASPSSRPASLTARLVLVLIPVLSDAAVESMAYDAHCTTAPSLILRMLISVAVAFVDGPRVSPRRKPRGPRSGPR